MVLKEPLKAKGKEFKNFIKIPSEFRSSYKYLLNYFRKQQTSLSDCE